jgi:flagellar biosynthesis/type III secretory pathway chaperone
MTLVQQMMDILDEERDALLAGHYEQLETLADRKEALGKRLEKQGGLDNGALERLAGHMTRNAALIDAAGRGFRQAEAEIRDIRKGMTQATYGSDGARHSLARPHARLEQKL